MDYTTAIYVAFNYFEIKKKKIVIVKYVIL